MTARILVTGGFGFLGSHLIEALLKEDDRTQVHVVDNLSTSPLPLERLLHELKSTVSSLDRLTWDIASVADWCDAHRTDREWSAIYHLASIVGPATVLKHAGNIVGSVVEDTYRLMELAPRCSARLVDVSTSEVYGGGQEGHCSEDFARIIPATTSARLEYAVAKLAAEIALQNRCDAGDLDAVIVRPFNISGPRQSGIGGFVLPRFLGLAMLHRPLTIFSGGTQLRAFTHVADIAAGLALAMRRGQSGRVYNLGNPANRLTINELADLVLDVTGSNAGKTFVDPRTIYGPRYAEANDKYPNADRAMRELAWEPQFSAREVVQQTFDYMKRLPDNVMASLAGVATDARG